jgi:hypothetical protein
MAEMPPYSQTDAAQHTSHPMKGQHTDAASTDPMTAARHAVTPDAGIWSTGKHGHGEALCDPHCTWQCGPEKSCDQNCTPSCAPPKCATFCAKSRENCETRCAEPRCAVVCPATHDCLDGKCPRCKTVCSPPLCTTSCAPDDCQSKCARPVCSWTCKKSECPMPKCQLNCVGLARCGLAYHVPPNRNVEFPEGHTVKSSNMGSLDVADLNKPGTAPPLWEVTTTSTSAAPLATTVAAAASATGAVVPSTTAAASPSKPTSTTVVGPVQQLKDRWAEEDSSVAQLDRHTAEARRVRDGRRSRWSWR